jgi:ElaB/YqjD/DUF883 family membrane-anchored ribosome-binding protein
MFTHIIRIRIDYMNTRSELSNHSATGQDAGHSLAEDLHAVIADVQSLLQATASQGGDALNEIRTNIARSIQAAKQRLEDNEAMLLDHSKAAIKASDAYVHLHPWQSAAIAVALGFTLAWAIKR